MDLSPLATVGDVVAAAAVRYGDRPALRMPDGRARSYLEVADRSQRLGRALRAKGLGSGDRVAVLSKNRIEYLEVLFSSMAGLVPVPLNWRLTERELAVILEDSKPGVIIIDAAFRATIAKIRPELTYAPLVVALDGGADDALDYESLLASVGAEGSAHNGRSTDIACIIYTSGTTGKPKGVELTHQGLLLNCRTCNEQVLHLTTRDIGLTSMPLFHVGGMWYHMFPSYAAGSTTTIVPEFNPREMLGLLKAERVSHIHIVPTMLHALLAQPDFAGYDLSHLRLIFYAGSSIPVELLKRALLALPACDFVQCYGSTEGGMISHLNAAAHRLADNQPELLETCGRPLPSVDVKLDVIASEASGGSIGEILARSTMMMRGYWGNPEATAGAFDGGWLRTGDIGRIDADGNLAILDRKNDMIVTGGENVFPREIEDALLADPVVAEVAVFDLPDPTWVQRVVAAVVLRPGAAPDADAMVQRLRSRLAAYKCPKQIFFTDALPKNGAGKVLRKTLRADFGQVS